MLHVQNARSNWLVFRCVGKERIDRRCVLCAGLQWCANGRALDSALSFPAPHDTCLIKCKPENADMRCARMVDGIISTDMQVVWYGYGRCVMHKRTSGRFLRWRFVVVSMAWTIASTLQDRVFLC